MKDSGTTYPRAAFCMLVVADRAGRVQGLVDVAGLEDVARALGVMAPDAGVAVGLQLEADGKRVASRLVRALLRRVHLVGDAEQVLHVMPDLVRDHVGLGEVAGRAEAVLQLAVEREVDVDGVVVRAIEGTHGRLRDAAGRLYGAAEEHELGIFVVTAKLLLEDRLPGVLRVGEYDRHELRHLVLRRRSGRPGVRGPARFRGRGLPPAAVEHDAGVAAQEVDHQGENGHADAPAHDGHSAPAGVDDIVASTAFTPSHGAPPRG